MAYSPGVRDQEPFPDFEKKVKNLADLLERKRLPNVDIAVDGGLSEELIRKYRDCGANFFVLGSTGLFVASRPLDEQLDRIKSIFADHDA